MRIFLENEADPFISADMVEELPGFMPEKWNAQELVEKTVSAVLAHEGIKTEVEVSVTFVPEEDIRVLNRENRGKDQVTDVLSFPMLSYSETPRKVTKSAEDLSEAYTHTENLDPENQHLYLGDIVICFPRAKEQALSFGHSLRREISFLTVHSMLHLLGYDHETKDSEQIMFGVQTTIMNQLNILREGGSK